MTKGQSKGQSRCFYDVRPEMLTFHVQLERPVCERPKNFISNDYHLQGGMNRWPLTETAIRIRGRNLSYRMLQVSPDLLSMVAHCLVPHLAVALESPKFEDSESQNDKAAKTNIRFATSMSHVINESHITWTFRSSISDSFWQGPRHCQWFITLKKRPKE